MNLVAYKIKTSNHGVIDFISSDGTFAGTSDSASFLLAFLHVAPNDTLRVCWDLDATVAPILRMLGSKKCTQLHNTHNCIHENFHLFYIPNKVFSSMHRDNHQKASLYGLQQYFPDKEEPKNIEEVATLGNKLLEALAKMNLYPSKLSSPIAIWEERVMSHLNLPTAWAMPKEAAEYAWYCSGKLWTEAYQIGYWTKAYDYDIVASFPTIAKDLIDIRHCNWIKTEAYVEEAIYGYCKCKVIIHQTTQVSPIIYTDEEGNLSTPTGTWETYLTKAELDFIRDWEIGIYFIIDGWWAVPKWKPSKPLEHVMNRLLAYKDHEDELVRFLAKRMSVGIYGKFGEDWKDRFGPHFNPAWLAEISTQVRLKVAEFIYQNKLESNLIHVSTDGVLLDREVEL